MRHIKLFFGLALCLGVLTNSPAAQAEPLQTHIEYIEARMKALDQLYDSIGDNPAKKTLEAAFAKAGVTGEAKQYVDTWAGWLSVAWKNLKIQYGGGGFYEYHLRALQDSLRTVKHDGIAKDSDLAAIDRGMQEWKRVDEQMTKQLEELVGLYAKKAKVLDQKMAAQAEYWKTWEKLKALQEKKQITDEDYLAQANAAEQKRDAALKSLEGQEAEISKAIARIDQALDNIARKVRLFSAIGAGCPDGATRPGKEKTFTLEVIDLRNTRLMHSSAYIRSEDMGSFIEWLKFIKEGFFAGKTISSYLEDPFLGMLDDINFPDFFTYYDKMGDEVLSALDGVNEVSKRVGQSGDYWLHTLVKRYTFTCKTNETCVSGKWQKKCTLSVKPETKVTWLDTKKEMAQNAAEGRSITNRLFTQLENQNKAKLAQAQSFDQSCKECHPEVPGGGPEPSPQGGTGSGSTTQKNDCGKFSEEIDRVKTAIEYDDLRIEKLGKELSEHERDREALKKNRQKDADAAKAGIDKAREELKRANTNKANLTTNPNLPDPNTWKNNLASADARLRQAESSVQSAEDKLKALQTALSEDDHTIHALRAELDRIKTGREGRLEDIKHLHKELDACKKRNQ